MRILFLILLVASISSFTINQKKKDVSERYNIELSMKYAAFSAVAFCSAQSIQQWKCGTTAQYPLINVRYIDNTVTKAICYIGYESSTKSIIISWRGSSNIQNWIQDFNFEMVPYTKCKSCFIHTGFIVDYELNEIKIIATINELMKSNAVERIICTGHSLGAAISSLTGMELALKYPNIIVDVHNFGSPRVGNQNLAQFISSKVSSIFRVVHNKDAVPHLPPEIIYRHPAYEVFFDETMTKFQICDQSGEDINCSNKLSPFYDPKDHDFYFVHISQVKC